LLRCESGQQHLAPGSLKPATRLTAGDQHPRSDALLAKSSLSDQTQFGYYFAGGLMNEGGNEIVFGTSKADDMQRHQYTLAVSGEEHYRLFSGR
jgi:hypothetical protein